MISFRLTNFLALSVFIAQAFAIINYVSYSDGSYGWQYSEPVSHMSPDQVRNAARSGYQAMLNDARSRRKNAPSVMASLFIPTQRGGFLVLASSIKRAPAGDPSIATANYCSDQHIHGNCAEMNAFALVDHHQINCRNSLIAAYGLQGGRLTFMPPCRDRDGRWGCGSFCTQSQITPVTKRTRIEGTPNSDLGKEKRAASVTA
ncbi:hypothetical protein B0O99DRAFT_626435 [Bisporella sp. PMI_857]|nr:hypothetical protein B0O99DRAFT_626435 [Bisporella sp. PMI_857]